MSKNSITLQIGEHQRGADKTARIPLKVVKSKKILRKPDWIRIKVRGTVSHLKTILRKHHLHMVCEEGSCPNLNECFSGGIATFFIMGDICT